MKLYQEIARAFCAYQNCVNAGHTDWEEKHERKLDMLIEQLPHGSGIDGTTELNFALSKKDRIVIDSSYHVMNENGMYEGWIDFKIKITPSLLFGFELQVSGAFNKHQDIKEYLMEIFGDALDTEVAI